MRSINKISAVIPPIPTIQACQKPRSIPRFNISILIGPTGAANEIPNTICCIIAPNIALSFLLPLLLSNDVMVENRLAFIKICTTKIPFLSKYAKEPFR